jgi:endoglycosylceramidase
VVFAPHLYVGSLSLDRTVGQSVLSISSEFDEAQREAARDGTTFWSGEWGWFGDPATQASQVAEYASQEDSHLVGGAWWQWKQACGDPHNLSGGEPSQWTSPSLNRYQCTPTSVTPLGIPAPFGAILSRAYPRAAPGRIVSLTSDPASGAMDLRGTTSALGVLEVWAPAPSFGQTFAGSAPTVTGTNLSRVDVESVPGGYRIRAVVAGSYELLIGR